MRTITIETTETNYKKIIDFVKQFPDTTFYDDDYTKDDEKAYQEGLKELKNGETTSLEDLKKELNFV